MCGDMYNDDRSLPRNFHTALFTTLSDIIAYPVRKREDTHQPTMTTPRRSIDLTSLTVFYCDNSTSDMYISRKRDINISTMRHWRYRIQVSRDDPCIAESTISSSQTPQLEERMHTWIPERRHQHRTYYDTQKVPKYHHRHFPACTWTSTSQSIFPHPHPRSS